MVPRRRSLGTQLHLKIRKRASRLAEWITAPAVKPVDPSLIPGTHTAEGET